MTPDDALFIHFALNAGLEHNDNIKTSAALIAGQAFLDHNGYHVWTVQQAIDIVRDDTDLHLAARLLEHLIYWFFVARL